MATWKDRIKREMSDWGERWKDVIGKTLNTKELAFDPDTTDPEQYSDDDEFPGKCYAWTLWTKGRVYFPVFLGYSSKRYPNTWRVDSVPRNPCDEQIEAVTYEGRW